jgi:two-component system sensor histidine kinase KdpD
MNTRPDPDDLLERVMRDEDRQARGRLKIFFGFSAGVGKTYAMLAAAARLREQGIDVVAGVIETHARAETEALLEGLERLPLRRIAYRERELPEFDLDAALQRKPQVMLVDELAHSNVPGSRHAKRWQDIDELLRAGIDVYTTVNVQHIESLNDVVGQITGIRVFETIPDHVFDQADDVMLVDIPPDELLQRLQQGKVYLPQQAEKAGRNFFRKGNLIALREIALRRTADRVDADMREYRADRSIAQLWQTKERIVLALGNGAGEEKLIRAAARLASKLQADWLAVHVDMPARRRDSLAGRERIAGYLKLAQSLGAEVATITGDELAPALLQFARSRNAGKLVIGQRRGGLLSRRRLFSAPDLQQQLAALNGELDVYTVARAQDKSADDEALHERSERSEADAMLARHRTRGYLWASFSCALTTLLAWALIDLLHPANVIMLYLVGVMLVAMRFGRSASALVSVLSVLAFDFFFVAPRFSISVSDVQYLITLGVMLAVSLFISSLTARLRRQARVAMLRETRASNLYMLGKELSALLTLEQILEIGRRHLGAVFGARTAFCLPDSHEQLQQAVAVSEGAADAHALKQIDAGVAQWVYDNGQPAGRGTSTLPAASALYLPLTATMRTRGVLVFESASGEDSGLQLALPENRQMLEIFCSQIAMAIERLHYAEVAQDALLTMESERLRNSLLSAISHDLRTPLTSLVGNADTLAASPQLDAEQRSLAQSIGEQSQRMAGLVSNLLDMARLQAGGVQLNRQWNALEEVVGSSLRLLQKALEGRRVEVQLPAGLPLLRFDAVLIERVFANLIENAVKYSPAGSDITVRALSEGAAVRISVSDRGAGFAAGIAAHAFDKFTRGDNESSTPGVGLGLAICRAIVEAHGGRIWIETGVQGGCVCFNLPLEPQPQLPPDEESNDIQDPNHA